MEHSYDWIISCIESSTNAFQFKCCYTLIELFEAMYKESEGNNIERLKVELEFALDNQKVKHSIEL